MDATKWPPRDSKGTGGDLQKGVAVKTEYRKRASNLLKKCEERGQVNPVTGQGAPTEEQIAYEFLAIESNSNAELSEVATYARRLIRIVRKTDPENAVAKSAAEFLRCIGLANPLR